MSENVKLQPETSTSTTQDPASIESKQNISNISRTANFIRSLVLGIVVAVVLSLITVGPLFFLIYKITGADDPGLGGLAVGFALLQIEVFVLSIIATIFFLKRSRYPDQAWYFIKFLGFSIALILLLVFIGVVGNFVLDLLGK